MGVCKKFSYGSVKSVQDAGIRMKTDGMLRASANVRAYYCNACTAYHLSTESAEEYMSRVTKNIKKHKSKRKQWE